LKDEKSKTKLKGSRWQMSAICTTIPPI